MFRNTKKREKRYFPDDLKKEVLIKLSLDDLFNLRKVSKSAAALVDKIIEKLSARDKVELILTYPEHAARFIDYLYRHQLIDDSLLSLPMTIAQYHSKLVDKVHWEFILSLIAGRRVHQRALHNGCGGYDIYDIHRNILQVLKKEAIKENKDQWNMLDRKIQAAIWIRLCGWWDMDGTLEERIIFNNEAVVFLRGHNECLFYNLSGLNVKLEFASHKLDLRYANCYGATISGDFKYANFNGANFENAIICSTSYDWMTVEGAFFKRTRFPGFEVNGNQVKVELSNFLVNYHGQYSLVAAFDFLLRYLAEDTLSKESISALRCLTDSINDDAIIEKILRDNRAFAAAIHFIDVSRRGDFGEDLKQIIEQWKRCIVPHHSNIQCYDALADKDHGYNLGLFQSGKSRLQNFVDEFYRAILIADVNPQARLR